MQIQRDADSNSNADSIKYGSAIKTTFNEYFEESSIHGLKYIGLQKESAIWERIIWLIAVILSISTCSYLVIIIWEKHTENTLIRTLDEKLTDIWEIPFPSVTICPATKTHSNIFNYTKILNKLADGQKITKEENYYWEAISQTCAAPTLSPLLYGNASVNASDLIQAMLKAGPKLNETIALCHWRNLVKRCEQIFNPVLTEDGICFSFNSLKSAHHRAEFFNSRKMEFSGNEYENQINLEWDLENGYKKLATIFPYHVIAADDSQSLNVFLEDKNEDEDKNCRHFVNQGFKLKFHTPGEEPQVSKNFINIPFDQEISFTIKPIIVTTSDGMRYYSPERRQCFYQNEMYLRYFKVFTQANCELECLANITFNACGCVKFSMPRNSSHPVCGAAKSIGCANAITFSGNTLKYFVKTNQHPNLSERSSCFKNCLPTCFGIEYKANIEYQVPYDHGYRDKRSTNIKIKFEKDGFYALKLSEMYTLIDFIANCGGLLALFMGFSILSFLEIVYFFTIRLWKNLQTGEEIQQHPQQSVQSNIGVGHLTIIQQN